MIEIQYNRGKRNRLFQAFYSVGELIAVFARAVFLLMTVLAVLSYLDSIILERGIAYDKTMMQIYGILYVIGAVLCMGFIKFTNREGRK